MADDDESPAVRLLLRKIDRLEQDYKTTLTAVRSLPPEAYERELLDARRADIEKGWTGERQEPEVKQVKPEVQSVPPLLSLGTQNTHAQQDE